MLPAQALMVVCGVLALGAALEAMDISDSEETVCRSYWTYEGVRTDCSNRSLTAVPLGSLDGDVHILDMSHNHVTEVTSVSFASPQLLKTELLYMDDNGLVRIHPLAFRHMKLLRTLKLRYNRIAELHPLTFSYNKRLQELCLSGNPLALPTSGGFLSIPMLLLLHMDNCNLARIPSATFSDLPTLRALILSHNRIDSLEEKPFSSGNLASLLYLNLSNNILSSLSPELFSSLENLIRLDVQNNHLQTIKISPFLPLRRLRRIELGGNPLQCDCELQPFRLWVRNESIATTAQCVHMTWNHLLHIQC